MKKYETPEIEVIEIEDVVANTILSGDDVPPTDEW